MNAWNKKECPFEIYCQAFLVKIHWEREFSAPRCVGARGWPPRAAEGASGRAGGRAARGVGRGGRVRRRSGWRGARASIPLLPRRDDRGRRQCETRRRRGLVITFAWMVPLHSAASKLLALAGSHCSTCRHRRQILRELAVSPRGPPNAPAPTFCSPVRPSAYLHPWCRTRGEFRAARNGGSKNPQHAHAPLLKYILALCYLPGC